MSRCTCSTDKEVTCIVHPTDRSLKDRIQKLENRVEKWKRYWDEADRRGDSLEAQLAAEREKPSLTRVSGVGQIRAGSPLLLETRDGGFVPAKAKLVLFPGDPGEEEVVYRKRMNHYFITGMVLNGTSHIRNVWIVRATAPEQEDKNEHNG